MLGSRDLISPEVLGGFTEFPEHHKSSQELVCSLCGLTTTAPRPLNEEREEGRTSRERLRKRRPGRPLPLTACREAAPPSRASPDPSSPVTVTEPPLRKEAINDGFR